MNKDKVNKIGFCVTFVMLIGLLWFVVIMVTNRGV
jgi:hypothetical protein